MPLIGKQAVFLSVGFQFFLSSGQIVVKVAGSKQGFGPQVAFHLSSHPLTSLVINNCLEVIKGIFFFPSCSNKLLVSFSRWFIRVVCLLVQVLDNLFEGNTLVRLSAGHIILCSSLWASLCVVSGIGCTVSGQPIVQLLVNPLFNF
uniref:ORF 145 n=1 Tax=Lactococcus phage mv4 TaxID=12392 RepID=Q9G0D1_BPMV4|nr:ORF 145 [Lactobacillus phage mv4]